MFRKWLTDNGENCRNRALLSGLGEKWHELKYEVVLEGKNGKNSRLPGEFIGLFAFKIKFLQTPKTIKIGVFGLKTEKKALSSQKIALKLRLKVIKAHSGG